MIESCRGYGLGRKVNYPHILLLYSHLYAYVYNIHNILYTPYTCICVCQVMDILVAISAHYHMWKTMLTCFKINNKAILFYNKIGFSIDCNSPSSHGHNDECYEILSNKPTLK